MGLKARTSVAAHVALLRGVNVGGKNKLRMADLVRVFEQLGCVDVSSYIQSGNVVFRAPRALAASIATRASDALADRHGLRVAIVTRTAGELAAILRGCPFEVTAPRSVYVGFFAAAPSRADIARVDPTRSPADEFEIRGREVYVRYAEGAGRSKLTNAYLESMLGTTSTMRNWNTVRKLGALSAELVRADSQ